MKLSENQFILDELGNAKDSLKRIEDFLNLQGESKWKWIAIAAHHSFYSYCIIPLTNGNYENVTYLKKDGNRDYYYTRGDGKFYKSCICKIAQKENRPYHRIGWSLVESFPEKKESDESINQKLIGFWTALARVMDLDCFMGKYVYSKALKLTDDELEKIGFL